MTSPSPDTAALSPLQRAFIALEETRARLKVVESAAHEPVAIIGIGLRVPGGASDPASFWQLLHNGVDATGPVPADRWDVDAYYNPDPEHAGTIAVRRGGFLGAVDGFDPGFFGIARREAQGMDPQQRLLLEVAWEALEHAGQAPDKLARSSTGVYVGMAANDYAHMQLATRDATLLDPHFASGIGHSVASGRLSYVLGLQGPSLTIDTACSSSLVAVHQAVQALRAGDCRMALAGGVSLILSPENFIALSRSRMLSPDGRCRTFDAEANGFARAEGCGVVVLKRMRDAEADGDRILAVIRGSAVNQDGASSGLTAPNGPQQEAVIRDALARADVTPHQVGYVEAHGTATPLGDPLELQALGAVFGPDRPAETPLYVGSVKTNLGHLEAAAGVTALIKLVLSLQHRTIPKHLHFTTPSPHIPWRELPVRVPTSELAWPAIDGRRIAGVSSFGFSGTNAHVVVEAAPEVPASAHPSSPLRRMLCVLSATSERALQAMASAYAEAFVDTPEPELANICFTSAVSRAAHPYRAAITACTMQELRDGLAALARGESHERVRTIHVTRRDPARIAFLFTGQGSQYDGMLAQLLAHEPVFRDAIDRCAAVLDPLLGRTLRSLLDAGAGTATLLDETQFTQPALFAVEYALTCLWEAWGVTPAVVMGHSVGEYVAACVAGVMSLEDALRLITERGRLMQALPAGGAMAAIFAAEAEVVPFVEAHAGRLSIAAVNGPGQTVISGTSAAVEAVSAVFAAQGTRVQRLSVSHAFHSPLMTPMLADFGEAAARVSYRAPRIRVISNVTGAVADPAVMGAAPYWHDHVRASVRFADGLRSLAALQPDIVVEVGPHPALLVFAQEVICEGAPVFVASARKSLAPYDQLADALGTLFLAGAPIDWRRVWSAHAVQLVDLPTYPFQRERCWFTARTAGTSIGRATGHPLLGVRLRSGVRDILQFEAELRGEDVPYLRDHVVAERTILPGAAFVEMVLNASQFVHGGPYQVQDLVIGEPLVVDDGDVRRVQTLVRLHDGAAPTFEIVSAPADTLDDAWTVHVHGVLTAQEAAPAALPTAIADGEEVTAAAHLERLASRGLVFGPSLRGVRRIVRCDGTAQGEIMLPEAGAHDESPYIVSPALLDACLQVLAWAVPTGAARDVPYLPLLIDRIRVFRTPRGRVTSHAVITPPATRPSETFTGQLVIADDDGIVAMLDGITLRAAHKSVSRSVEQDLYTVAWERLHDATPWTPSAEALSRAVSPRLATLATEHDLAAYAREYDVLEACATRWIVRALHELGWVPERGETVDVATLCATLRIESRYHRLVPRLLTILSEDGLLRRVGDAFAVIDVPVIDVPVIDVPVIPPRDAILPHAALASSTTARTELTERCGEALAGILRGEIDPLALLFPDGSSATAEMLYRESPEAKAFNQLAGDAVRELSSHLPPGRPLRVLEVGGGTGGTTTWVAPLLETSRTQYLFTDIGPLLVERARAHFGAAYPFMEFAALDLEHDLTAQLPADRQFDLIIASNVVHATADLRETLRRLRRVLAPGGVLLMLEVAGRERWIDLTFALTEGWWRFADADLRPDYPLLSRDAWVALLTSEGFEATTIGAEHPHSREVLLAGRKPDHEVVDAGGQWLVFADVGGTGDALASRLRHAGQRVHLVPFPGLSDASATLRAATAAHGATAKGIVHLWSLDVLPMHDESDAAVLPSQAANLEPLLTLVQTLGTLTLDSELAPRLWIVTRGAQAVRTDDALDVAQSAVWGFGLGVAREHPELRPTRIDLDPNVSITMAAEQLAARLADSSVEDQLALRGGSCFVPRLAPLLPVMDEESPRLLRRVERAASGVLEDVSLVVHPRPAPGPGCVEIAVHAAGMNFRDVLNAMAMRNDTEPLGGECAGRISAVGAGVTGHAVGDAVIAVAEAAFATFATARADEVLPMPSTLSFADAATLPFAFMTALFALEDCARLQAGDTVLIHAAAGGVGLAAVQLARLTGATVIATAGSDAKRAYLKEQGVEYVFDSRATSFAADVLRVTEGRGADVILNSLSGDFIAASVSCLASRGRFLEIGKREIWSAQQFAGTRPDGAYFAIDLARMRIDEPQRSHALFRRVTDLVTSDRIRPLALRAFALGDAASAFSYMAHARHIGKVVLTPERATRHALDRLSPDASYLITGGLSGLGLFTACELAERGARHLVLTGRRAPSPETETVIAGLRANGVSVQVLPSDVGDADAVARMISVISTSAPPLRGVVHSAGALDDGALLQLTWPRFEVPLRAKIEGAWALHHHTRHLPLDFFVMYSSVASVLGSSGQSNHSAANAFMDALAHHRRAAGLPATSISWGAWSEIGAAADRQVDRGVGAVGVRVITPPTGREMLHLAVEGTAPHVTALPVDWQQLRSHRHPTNGSRFLDRVLPHETPAGRRGTVRADRVTGPATSSGLDLEALRDATPARRHAALLAFTAEHVARVLSAPSANLIDPEQPLNELGLDSLMAVELRNRLGRGLQLTRNLPATLVFDHPTLSAITQFLVDTVFPPSATPGAGPSAAPTLDSVGAIDELSDEQIDAMFANRLRNG